MKCEQELPPPNTRVLLFDRVLDRWVIATMSVGPKWILDPKIFYGVDNTRYSDWQPLPGRP